MYLIALRKTLVVLSDLQEKMSFITIRYKDSPDVLVKLRNFKISFQQSFGREKFFEPGSGVVLLGSIA